MATTRATLAKVHAAFMERRHQVHLHNYRVKMAKRIQGAYRRWAERKNAAAAGRLRLTTRSALTILTMHTHEETRKKACAAFLEFMTVSAQMEEFRSSTVNFLTQIKKLSSVMH